MCVIHFSSLTNLHDFMRAHSLFNLKVPPFEKVPKRKAENNLFQFCFTLRKCFVFVICRHFTTSKWLNVLKLSKVCLKMVKCMTSKTTDQNILFLNVRIPFNLHCRFNESGIKLLLLINNYLWIKPSETLVCQTQDVCGQFQSENWTEHVSTGHSYALLEFSKWENA